MFSPSLRFEIYPLDSTRNLLISLLAALCISIFYCVAFHPLARVPGPFLAKFSDFWHAYQVYTGTRHTKLCHLHDRYGPIIRIGPNTVSVNSKEGLQKIFSATSPIHKSPFYKAFAPGFESSFAAVGDAFKEKRSIISHAFAQKKLEAMETTFMKHINRLYDFMALQQTIYLDDLLSALTIDILSDVCFGETFDLIHNPAEKARVSEGLVQAAKWVSLEGTLWRWPLLQKVVRLMSNKFTTRRYPAQRAIGAMIKQRKNDLRKEDIFQYLLTATKPGTDHGFPDKELFGEAIILFIAGSDTTSTALLTILWHLMADKQVYKTLSEEVRSKFKCIDEITWLEAQHLPYLRAVIDEGLRMFPPNSGYIPRQVINSSHSFILHEVILPPGTEVGVSNLSLHRNPLYFQKPREFIPERWLSDDKTMRDMNVFSPFSKGPRSCLGRNMAYIEMTLVIAVLILDFDMEFDDPIGEVTKGYTPTDSFVLIRPKVRVVAKKRQP